MAPINGEPCGPRGARGPCIPGPAALQRLVERGRREGTFAADVPPGWLLASFRALVHAAGQEVGAGRLDAGAAAEALPRTVLRAFGARAAG